MIIWSSDGNIAAGSASKTVASAPPTRVLIDPQSADVGNRPRRPGHRRRHRRPRHGRRRAAWQCRPDRAGGRRSTPATPASAPPATSPSPPPKSSTPATSPSAERASARPPWRHHRPQSVHQRRRLRRRPPAPRQTQVQERETAGQRAGHQGRIAALDHHRRGPRLRRRRRPGRTAQARGGRRR